MHYIWYKLSYTMSATTQSKSTGQVKWFNTKSGYGFITALDGDHKGNDVFVHYSSIHVSNNQYVYLVTGEYVEFAVVRPDKQVKEGDSAHEFHAVDISGIMGGKLMCEVRHENTEARPARSTDASAADARPARRPARKSESETRPARNTDSAPAKGEGEFKTVRKRVVAKKTA